MFKKLYEAIDVIRVKINCLYETISDRLNTICQDMQSMRISIQHMPTIKSMEQTITSQQRTIEQLTNALKDKYEHGLFVYSEDGQVIKAIQDGEEISLNRMSYLDVTWSAGEAVGVTIERR